MKKGNGKEEEMQPRRHGDTEARLKSVTLLVNSAHGEGTKAGREGKRSLSTDCTARRSRNPAETQTGFTTKARRHEVNAEELITEGTENTEEDEEVINRR
jgi:hypothetical protein